MWQGPKRSDICILRVFRGSINSSRLPGRMQSQLTEQVPGTRFCAHMYVLITNVPTFTEVDAAGMSTWKPTGVARAQDRRQDRSGSVHTKPGDSGHSRPPFRRSDAAPTRFSDDHLRCVLATVWYNPDHTKCPFSPLGTDIFSVHLMDQRNILKLSWEVIWLLSIGGFYSGWKPQHR